MSVDNFDILAFVDRIGTVTTPGDIQMFGSQGYGILCWTPVGLRMEWQIGSPSRRGDILLGAPPIFGSFRAAKMTPFWDPNLTPPCGQLAAPYLYAHREPGPNSKLCTKRKSPGSCLPSCEPLAFPWPGEPRVRMMPILVILAS